MSNERPSFDRIAQIIGAEQRGEADKHGVRRLLIDSRHFRRDRNALFFAISGRIHDGHDYIKELFSQGVRHFVVERIPESSPADACYFLVNDCVSALQLLTAAYRKRFQYPVLAITGSNGKTIVKEWAFQLLQNDFRIVRSPRSYNSQVGVPLSVWGMDDTHELAIIEAGISKPGEMGKLKRIIRPDIGIMTNIGSAHQEHFKSIAAKVKTKMQLFKKCKLLIYCSDHEEVHKRALKLNGPELFSWSRHNEEAKVFLTEVKQRAGFSRLDVQYEDRAFNFRIPFTDAASVENSMHLLCLMLHLQVPRRAIQRRMSMLQSVDMRLELKDGIQGSLLISDSYNSDLESLRIALEFMETHKKRRRSVVILSDMKDSASHPEKWIQPAADLISRMKVDEFIGVGGQLSRHANVFPVEARFFMDTVQLLQKIGEFDWRNSIVLLKGARVFAFENLQQRLEERVHQTVLRINLNAIAENLNAQRTALPAGVKLMAVVKAFSYGAGSSEVASLLQFQKVDYLAVAYTDEGVSLRQAGVSIPIMVMNPEPEALSAMIAYKLEPEIYGFRMLELFLHALNKHNYRSSAYPIHLKLDTGMHRLGFEEEQLLSLLNILKEEPQLEVISVFSHLAASDDPQFRKETLMQIERFRQMAGLLESGLQKPILKHILNSAGIATYPEAHFDMVRTGIGLHGVINGVPVAGLYSHISQIKWLRKGESIGYGFSYTAEQDMKIATLAIGYADGFNRLLSNGVGEVFIRGKRAKVVGRVCMDLTMVDVTDILCEEGDEVEIFGEHIRVTDLADKLGTIPYEVLTSVSPRVKRIYIQE